MGNSIKNSRVFITGGGGFIGSHLARCCLSLGASVAVLVTPKESCWRILDISKDMEIFEGSITEHSVLEKIIEEFRPHYVFHLAAMLHRGLQFDIFNELYRVNVGGTSNLLSVLMESDSLKRFIYTGTIEEYGSGEAPFRESQRELPVSPYSLTKAMATKLVQYVAREENFPAVIVRAPLVYGPTQNVERFMIPNIILSCMKDKEILLPPGEQTRDFLFVEDLANGITDIAVARGVDGEIINLGSGKETSFKEAVLLIHKLVENEVNDLKFGAAPYRKNEIMRSLLDINKAKRIISWLPKTSLEDGLTKTVEWYKASKKNNIHAQLAI